MSSNKKIAQDFICAMGAGDAEAVKSMITPDMKIVTRGHCKISVTHDHDAILNICKAFPLVTKSGIRFEILNLTAEDDRVACEADGFDGGKRHGVVSRRQRAPSNHRHFCNA